MSRLFI